MSRLNTACAAAIPEMSLPEMSKELGAMWKALSDEDKQPYKVCHSHMSTFTFEHCT